MANGPQDLDDRIKAVNERTNAEMRLNEILGKRSSLVAVEAQSFAEQSEQLERQLTILNDVASAEKEIAELRKKGKNDEADQLGKIANMSAAQRAEEEKRLRVQYDYVKARQTEREVGISITQNLLQSVGITDKWKSTTLGLAVAAGKTSAKFAEMAKSAMRVFSGETLDNLIGSTLMKITESTIGLITAVDSSMSSFNRMFGAAGRLNSELFELSINANQAGLLFSENMELVQGLASTFDMFLVTSKATRKSLIETAQQMHIFGVEAQTSGQLFNVLAKSLGESSSQIQQTATGIMEFALSIGAAPEEMVQAFTRLLPEFVRYGDRAKDVFGAVAKQAKALGTEIETLIGISQKFDTFEDAGVTAGKLMGILGQPIDVMGLMEMDPEQKIRSIIGMIEESGMQAEILNNKFGLLAMGDVLGISADEAAKLVRIGVAGYEEQLAKQKEIAIEEEARQKQLKAAQSIIQKIQQVVQEFAIENEEAILGLIDGIKGFLQVIIDVAGHLKEAFLPAVLGIMFALKMLSFRFAMATLGATASAGALKGAGMAAGSAAIKFGVILGTIALVIFAVISLVELLTSLSVETLASLAVNLASVTGSVLLLAGAMVGMAVASIAGIVGFGAMALGLVAVAAALQLIDTDDLVAIGNVFLGLGALAMAGTGNNFGNVVAGMKAAAKEAKAMSDTELAARLK